MAIRKTTTRKRGFSLIEVIMATALCSIALVSSLVLLRDGMELSRTIEKRQLLTNYAVSKIEENLAIAASTWNNGTNSGTFSADGHSDIRFSTSRSDAVADGGLVDRLMHIQVTTFHDANGDGTLGSTEKSCTMRTKLGKLATYEAL